MSGLILKLAPHERILINGAVIENGDRRSQIRLVSEKVNLLRLKDAIHPNMLDTPIKRICYSIQLVLSGDMDEIDAKVKIVTDIEKLARVFRDDNTRQLLMRSIGFINEKKFYSSLKLMRKLIPLESKLLPD